jgi:hypothetical protein
MIAKITLFLIIITAVIPANAQENIMINLNVGNLGFGVNVPSYDDYGRETIVTFLNVGIEHKETNLGIEFTPLKYFGWRNPSDEKNSSNDNNNDTSGYSFANLKFFWNVFNFEFFYIGPFTSIDYMFIEKTINWNRYVFTGGIQFGFRAYSGKVNYNIFTAEIGYRNIDGKSKYFIGGKIDIPVFFISVLYATASSESSKKEDVFNRK